MKPSTFGTVCAAQHSLAVAGGGTSPVPFLLYDSEAVLAYTLHTPHHTYCKREGCFAYNDFCSPVYESFRL